MSQNSVNYGNRIGRSYSKSKNSYKIRPRMSLALTGTNFFSVVRESMNLDNEITNKDYNKGEKFIRNETVSPNLKINLQFDNSPRSPSRSS